MNAIIRLNDNEEECSAWYAKSIRIIKFISPYLGKRNHKFP